ncbi:MAG: chemotaxis protein CheW [Treponema sp.]|nr:chemotaxis protein CheW [Spirochaetia bacterium]MDD7450342.1 chemotaxis protein CheW [Treponema sp.]MDY2923614.1 chemotaxis protein CheW [Treponema sp.]
MKIQGENMSGQDKPETNNFFTFNLGKGNFALPVKNVKEVLNYEPVSSVPKALPYIKGVMNIRGSVVTVIDLRTMFGFDPVKPIEKNSIIVTEIEQENAHPLTIGIFSDSVNNVTPLEIINADTADYGVIPNRKDFISGIGKIDGKFILILDLEKILFSINAELEENIEL